MNLWVAGQCLYTLRINEQVSQTEYNPACTYHYTGPVTYHFIITSLSLHYHFIITSLSLHYHFIITSLSLQYHFSITSVSLQYHFIITSLSLQYQFSITSVSLQYHFSITSVSLQYHFFFVFLPTTHPVSITYLLQSLFLDTSYRTKR